MTGGLSHLDTFDYKPMLQRDHDKPVIKGQKKLLGSPYAFRPRGECGKMVSELFTDVGSVVDEFCFLHSVHGDSAGHSAATLGMLTGSVTIPMPSLGSWISYGLGTLNLILPSFIVLAAKDPYNGFQVWDANFLPACHKGVRLTPGADPLPNVEQPDRVGHAPGAGKPDAPRPEPSHLAATSGRPGAVVPDLTTFDTARGLMREAPEAFDIRREPKHTLDLYGATADDPSSFAAQCLVARRLVERGVRVVELFDVGSNSNWDSHTEIDDHAKLVAQRRPAPGRPGDGPEAARPAGRDVDRRLLRVRPLPLARPDPARPRPPQRAASPASSPAAGSSGGFSFGRSDEYGNRVAENPVHVHDLHATILHIMGLDHTRLTYRYSGRDFRLTDVHGRVVRDVLA